MKLWDKGLDVDEQIEKFTVGDDFILDQNFVHWDCIASIAHAKMLYKASILSETELQQLESGLNEIIDLDKKGEFKIKPEDEDCHTAIENYLTMKHGEAGKKIHTARSRNDQVIAALKLYMKYELGIVKKNSEQLIASLDNLGKKNITLPGYTHSRKAMPSSIKMWAAGYSASINSDMIILDAAIDFIDSNPLGSAAGFGVNLPLDRALTTELLGFKRIQELAEVQISRGKNEAAVINALLFVMLDLGKMSSDLILFSMPEFGYFELPENFCTGSSIMPQKKNPDILELVRAKAKVVQSNQNVVQSIINGLNSSYSRDFQLTKKPLMESIETAKSCLFIMTKLISEIKVNKANCEKAMTKELYAADEANELVKKGVPFREAYKRVGKKYL